MSTSSDTGSPGRKQPCPCGSGVQYRRCCMLHVSQLARSGIYLDRFNDQDYKGALQLVRAEFTRYIGWHHRHTLTGQQGLPADIAMVDLRALSELLFVRMKCMDRLGRRGELGAELARLAGASSHRDWALIHAYVTAFAYEALLDRREEGLALMLAFDWRSICYAEVLEFLMDVAGDTLGIGDSLDIASRIVETTQSEESRLQYRLLRALFLMTAGDSPAAGLAVTAALADYQLVIEAGSAKPYGKMWMAEGILLRDRLNGVNSGVSAARALAFEVLREEQFTAAGKSRMYMLLGATFEAEAKSEVALNFYRQAYRESGDVVALFRELHLLLDGQRFGEITVVAAKVRATRHLGSGYALELYEIEACVAVAQANVARVRELLTEVEALEDLPPLLEPSRRDLRLGLVGRLRDAASPLTPAPTAAGAVPLDPVLEWLWRVSRYAELKPSISGVGVNLNAIIDDFVARRRAGGG